jgi:NADH-quinone oxidoreductase subunit C
VADEQTDTADPAGDAEETVAAPVDENRNAIVESFREHLGDAVVDAEVQPGQDVWVRVRSDAWRNAAEVARNALGARYFCFLSVIDWLPSPYGRSMDASVDLELARLAGEEPASPSTELAHGVAGGETQFQLLARVADVGTPGGFWGVTLKADVDDSLTIDSWVPVYAGADWHEREAWEMFGVTFAGHPGLRHMYLPSDFEGHPMRKRFPLLARMVKPWPGIVDVEPMPGEDDAGDAAGDADGSGTTSEEAES